MVGGGSAPPYRDKAQEERDWVLQQFKDGEQPLLIATDVAQRGLDIKGVACVINYDCPNTGEGYVHRIGRTGRAGNSGTAYTFVAAEDRRVAPELVRVLKAAPDGASRAAQLAQEARRGSTDQARVSVGRMQTWPTHYLTSLTSMPSSKPIVTLERGCGGRLHHVAHHEPRCFVHASRAASPVC